MMTDDDLHAIGKLIAVEGELIRKNMVSKGDLGNNNLLLGAVVKVEIGTVLEDMGKLASVTRDGFKEANTKSIVIKNELRSEMHVLKTSIQSEIVSTKDQLRSDMKVGFKDVISEIKEIRQSLAKTIHENGIDQNERIKQLEERIRILEAELARLKVKN